MNPKHLVTMLGLDTGIQQDAQEFSKLFLTKLEKNFEHQKDPSLKKFIQGQFRGEYAYVTRCNKCRNEKCNPSEFSELDLTLQGNKTLAECLKAFLKAEKLDGDNKYLCGKCESKQNATRCVRLTKLPPVLNLQLNRFYFDMVTGVKRKLNTHVQFPEILDMSPHLHKAKGPVMYRLTGVLIHMGVEADEGHYVAHILESKSSQWFKFSDELVEKIEGGKHLKVGSENDPMMFGKGKKANGGSSGGGGAGANAKVPKGFQTSTSCYMLVYTEMEPSSTLSSLAIHPVGTNGIKTAEGEEKEKDEEISKKEEEEEEKVKKEAEVVTASTSISVKDEKVSAATSSRKNSPAPEEPPKKMGRGGAVRTSRH